MNTETQESHGAVAGQVERSVRPRAWMHPDGRVVPAATMDAARRDGGAMLTSLAGYTVPLYAPQDEAEFTVLAGDEGGDELDFVAGSSGPREQALREALHYAAQYARDGRVEVHELIRIPVMLPGA